MAWEEKGGNPFTIGKDDGKSFIEEEPTSWPKPDEDKVCKKLEELINIELCAPRPTGWIITDGPLCGLPVYSVTKDKTHVTYNPESGCFEEVDETMNTIGIPAPADKSKTCCTETVTAAFCADGADLVLDEAAILAGFPAGETFDLNGVAVDIAADGQTLVGAMIRVVPCPAPVTKADGSVFTTEAAEAVVTQASGAAVALYQGACQDLGDGKGDNAIVIDESITVKAGTAIYVDYHVRACFDPAGEIIVEG